MANVAIVTTSINTRPEVLNDWANVGDLIVAGDQNSPPELATFCREIGATYLSPERQMVQWEGVSDAIGWKCIQRRNIAIMYAMQTGFDYVLTVDDDNFPKPTASVFLEGHIENLQSRTNQFIGSRSGYLNTGELCMPAFHQRGVPYGMDTRPMVVDRDFGRPIEVVVSQAQIVGDPDCDAVERITSGPEVLAVTASALVLPGTYSAFNSQATLWRGDWAGVMACLPHVGRFDDIFASFIFARLARSYATTYYVGDPVMRQERNPHDLSKDLRAEVWGMRRQIRFCEALDLAYVSIDMPLWQAYSELIFAVRDILPTSTVKFANEWVDLWRKIAK